MQDIIFNQLKLQVNDSCKKDEKITTNFDPSNDKDVISKAYFDTKLSKTEGHISLIEKNYNDFKFKNNKQSVEEILNGKKLWKQQYSYYIIRDYLIITIMVTHTKF